MEGKMSKPLVSIVVPVCNVEKFLSECLDSVIKQTLKEIEIICVDDGSTDKSLEILKKYASTDNRIKVISKKNSGYGNTMNVGNDAATGEYIGIVESDDYVKPEMFERLYQTAKAYNADVVKSNHYTFSTKEGKVKKELHYTCNSLDYYNKVLNVKEYEEIYDFVMMNWTGIYKTDFLRKNNIRYNETPGASFQDNGYWFQVMTLAERIVFINEAFYFYRQDNPNSSINNKKKVYCICDEFDYMRKFLENHPEEYKRHILTYVKKKFFNYRHSYKRIADEYKKEFLLREQREYKEELKKLGGLKVELDSWVLGEMNRIIDSPELFYYEEKMESLKREAEETHQLWKKLRESKELQNGLKIKKFLHI